MLLKKESIITEMAVCVFRHIHLTGESYIQLVETIINLMKGSLNYGPAICFTKRKGMRKKEEE
ncbi:hypothetical protein BDB01DRAFT_810790 [Pilobolus umbonatus]|nr:hypothetical protein BDB01DRAFT_810790 [Pilobolus umbonatus]